MNIHFESGLIFIQVLKKNAILILIFSKVFWETTFSQLIANFLSKFVEAYWALQSHPSLVGNPLQYILVLYFVERQA